MRLVVLHDGETYSEISGCHLLDVPETLPHAWDWDELVKRAAGGEEIPDVRTYRLDTLIEFVSADYPHDSAVKAGARALEAEIERRIQGGIFGIQDLEGLARIVLDALPDLLDAAREA